MAVMAISNGLLAKAILMPVPSCTRFVTAPQ
jgi:hypothetical protein